MCSIVSSMKNAVVKFHGKTEQQPRKVGCDPEKDDCWHHQYYQWVGLVLLMQAGCVYVPR